MPTRAELLCRYALKSPSQAVCLGCNKAFETDFHVLFSCDVAWKFWMLPGLDLDWTWKNASSCLEVWTSLVNLHNRLPPSLCQ